MSVAVAQTRVRQWSVRRPDAVDDQSLKAVCRQQTCVAVVLVVHLVSATGGTACATTAADDGSLQKCPAVPAGENCLAGGKRIAA